jgi:hypothetical protein
MRMSDEQEPTRLITSCGNLLLITYVKKKYDKMFYKTALLVSYFEPIICLG